MLKKSVIILAISLAACASDPTLPDPGVSFPDPPAILMEPPQNLITIQEEPQSA